MISFLVSIIAIIIIAALSNILIKNRALATLFSILTTITIYIIVSVLIPTDPLWIIGIPTLLITSLIISVLVGCIVSSVKLVRKKE